MKILKIRWLVAILLLTGSAFILSYRLSDEGKTVRGIPSPPPPEFSVQRMVGNPLITFEHSESIGNNINGPSIIRVPDWIENPLGQYYMYFAHHKGLFIRLAYADSPEGPWTIHEPGVLHLKDAPPLQGHIASPDAHVDEENRQIILYVHGKKEESRCQKTIQCTSNSGLDFTSANQVLGESYFRVWKHENKLYTITNTGNLFRAKDPTQTWAKRKRRLIPYTRIKDDYGLRKKVRMRHAAVWYRDDHILVFYTRKEDAPERIFCARVDLVDNWRKWTPSEPVEIMRPEKEYEGANLPITVSRKGAAKEPEHALRDPAILIENDRIFLYYSIAGEQGIAGAELKMVTD